jgi:diguanylate cyclase (GGDEF)-like protein
VSGSFALLLATGAVHYWAGPAYQLSALYFVPVFLLAWFDGRSLGLTAAVLSSVLHLWADLAHAEPTTSPIFTVEVALSLGLAVVGAIALSGLRSSERELGEALTRERERAERDGLTALLNARAFTERLELELERTRRYGGGLSLLYLDLDNFKHVNDTYGHLAGDEVLRRVANAIATTVRQVDLAARLGGDEFVVLMPSTTAVVAGSAADRVHEAVTVALSQTDGVSASTGLVSCGTLPKTAQTLITRADQAMYDAKRQGKSRIVHHVVD